MLPVSGQPSLQRRASQRDIVHQRVHENLRMAFDD
jgi:hypothetical protein